VKNAGNNAVCMNMTIVRIAPPPALTALKAAGASPRGCRDGQRAARPF